MGDLNCNRGLCGKQEGEETKYTTDLVTIALSGNLNYNGMNRKEKEELN